MDGLVFVVCHGPYYTICDWWCAHLQSSDKIYLTGSHYGDIIKPCGDPSEFPDSKCYTYRVLSTHPFITVYGGDGDDMIVGTENNDALYGEDGDDTIRGSGGNDIIYGGYGRDSLYGGPGADWLFLGTNSFGTDQDADGFPYQKAYGGTGNDFIFGSTYSDDLFGEEGDDYITGLAGADLIVGGAGSDDLYGGSDGDCICGYDCATSSTSDGDDLLSGGSGSDALCDVTPKDFDIDVFNCGPDSDFYWYPMAYDTVDASCSGGMQTSTACTMCAGWMPGGGGDSMILLDEDAATVEAADETALEGAVIER